MNIKYGIYFIIPETLNIDFNNIYHYQKINHIIFHIYFLEHKINNKYLYKYRIILENSKKGLNQIF